MNLLLLVLVETSSLALKEANIRRLLQTKNECTSVLGPKGPRKTKLGKIMLCFHDLHSSSKSNTRPYTKDNLVSGAYGRIILKKP
jgi:hypothetical protein